MNVTGQVIGAGNFSGGETTIKRVSVDSSALLERCNGFVCEDGSIKPDSTVKQLSTVGALASTIAEQVPVAYVDDDTTTLVCRDKDTKLRKITSDTWSAAGVASEIIAESVPARYKSQVILPGKSELMIYEPNSPSTTLRPISLKSPADYMTNKKPTVTPSALTPTKLFDCDDANAWTGANSNYTVTTTTNKVALKLNSSVTANTQAFKKSLGSTGIAMDSHHYIVFDIKLENDQQNYFTYTGLFPNDANLYASGYILSLYSDTACTSVLASYYLPRLSYSGLNNRVVLKIALTGTAKGVSIDTASFFTPPASGNTYTMTLYSEEYTSTGLHRGNYLMGEIVNPLSPLVSDIESLQATSQTSVAIAPNAVLDESMESNSWAGDWKRFGNTDEVNFTSAYANDGTYSVVMGGTSNGFYQESIPVIAGKKYVFSFYYYTNSSDARTWHTEVQPKLGGANVGSPVTITNTAISGSWLQSKTTLTIPDTATSIKVKFTHDSGEDFQSHSHGVFIDDVALRAIDSTMPGSTIILQTFADDLTQFAPELPQVNYSCAFAGKDRLAADDFVLMVSNPTDPSTSVYYDPWRNYSVTNTLTTSPTEYGNYITHMLFYRSIYNGSTKLWSDNTFFAYDDYATVTNVTDEGVNADTKITALDRYAPATMEINNANASTSRYVVVVKDRVYAACLDWNSGTSKWARPTAIQVSSYAKPWAYPTLVTDNTLATDGTELDGYAVTGAVVRGLAVLDDDVLVMLDNEFFHLRGDDPITGFRFLGRQAVGCKSNKSIAVGRRFAIWHDGTNFVLYSGGMLKPISRFLVDSTLIDWTKSHSAVFYKDQYIFHCEYNGEWALIIYDSRSEAWRIRRSDALELVGICTDGETVFGVTPTGNAVDLFGGTADFGASSVVRELFTQYINMSPRGHDIAISKLVFDIVSSTSVDLNISVKVLGAKNQTLTRTLTTDTTKIRHTVGMKVKAEFVKIEITYTGTTPPDSIHFVGFDVDSVAGR